MDRHSTTSSNPRLKEYGPWTEQYSSSGKRYFYNRETEVSQWEKPPEWREYEKVLAENAANHSPISSSSGVRGGNTHYSGHPTATSTSNSVVCDEAKNGRRVKEVVRPSTSTPYGGALGPRAKRARLEVKEEDSVGPIVFNEEAHRKFFRPELVSELREWPSEEYEQSAFKADAMAHNLSLLIMNVSADVKCARSLVKTAEMRCTLLAQKLLFLAEHQRQLEASLTLPSLPSVSSF